MSHSNFAEWRMLFEQKVAKIGLLSGSAEELLEMTEQAHDLKVKQAALLSLAAHYPESEQLCKALEKLMHDARLGVVALGIISSQRLLRFLPAVRNILLEGEKHPPTVIGGALRALTELSETADSFQSELRQWLRHSHTEIRLAAAAGLVKLGDMDGLKIIEHALCSPVFGDRVAGQMELALLTLPSELHLSLLLKSLRSDALLLSQRERWKYRMQTINQIIHNNLAPKRHHKRTLRVLSQKWKRDSEAALRALIDSLRELRYQFAASGADDLAERVAYILSVIEIDIGL